MGGIDNIIELINSKTAEKEKEIVAEAEKHKKQQLGEANQKAKMTAEEITSKAETETKAEIIRFEASAKLKSKYQLLEAKDDLIEEILSSAKEHLEKMPGKKEYQKALERLVIDGAASLEETPLEIVLPKGHASQISVRTVESAVSKKTGKKTKLSVSRETIRATGGAIVRTTDNTRRVDNTFEERYVRFESALRDQIFEILFSTDKKEKK